MLKKMNGVDNMKQYNIFQRHPTWTAIIIVFIGLFIFGSILNNDYEKTEETGSPLRLVESNNNIDSVKEVPIGKFEDDIQPKNDDIEEIEPPEITPPPIDEEVDIPSLDKIKLASFNAQIFGDSKWKKLGGDYYLSLIQPYDLFILQEIRDIDQSSYNSLCSLLKEYDCIISARAGRSSSKEQIAIFYKDHIDLVSYNDAQDSNDVFEREPFKVIFDIDGYELIIWTTHIKPSDVENEMDELESLVEDDGNVIVIGDLNLDCSYDDGMDGDFEDWNYLISDNEDTTVSSTDCAYDRIILNDDSFNEYSDHGIDNSITSEESDHYLVWVELEV